MSKSVYSLMLSDEIMAEVDRLAYKNSSNRSATVNNILAEHFSFTTPEKRIRAVFSQMEDMLIGENNTFQTLFEPSDTMFTLRSALSYKYNPSVRYAIDLYPQDSVALGVLRVSVRSRNSTLLLYMLQFFKLWTSVELMLFDQIGYSFDEDKYQRILVPKSLSKNVDVNISDSKAMGQAAANYITAFDDSLKVFFDSISQGEQKNEAANRIKQIYKSYINKNKIVFA